MNARRERVDILTQSLFNNNAQTSQYETVLQHLQSAPTSVFILVTAITIYVILNYTGIVPFSLPQLLWNLIVYATPAQIVVALDSKTTKLDSTDENLLRMNFQTKSEAMQRILGIDSTSFSSFFPRSTTFSGFGTTLLGSKDMVPPGLGNWDNSCYQNSIIQGLASLRSLAEFLERNVDVLGERGSFSTHLALKGVIDRLNSADNSGQRIWTPAELKSMSSWQQQDAQEYFSKVIDQIDREVQQATRRQTRNLGLKMAGPGEHIIGAGSSQELVNGSASPTTAAENKPFRNPLEGLLAQRVGCMKCGFTEGLTLIPFNCLTVPLGANHEYDVRECLDHYMNLEPIEGVECAKCTLLRAKDQLQNILQQIEDDKELSNTPESPEVSGALKKSAQERLQAVQEALEESDFAEKTLSKKCHIPAKNRTSSTKSRQAVIGRAPKCLAIHINRSVFDERTGILRKNYAAVRFPKVLDLNEWCLGTQSSDQAEKNIIERWGTDPKESMLPQNSNLMPDALGRHYELRAMVTHYGRHENGHYICYRKYSSDTFPAHVPDAVLEADGEKEKSERWFQLSDEDVQMVSEHNVLSQGGAFMLFYEAIDGPLSQHTEVEQLDLTAAQKTESISSFATPEDMSIMSTATEDSTSDTSQATSISAAENVELPDEKTHLVPIL